LLETQSLKNCWREIGVTDGASLRKSGSHSFRGATETGNGIHLDQARQAIITYGTTSAHGFLTLSLIPQLYSERFGIEVVWRLSLSNGLNRVRFPASVRAIPGFRARMSLLALKECLIPTANT